MPNESYESLIAHVQEQERQLQEAGMQQRAAEQNFKKSEALAAKRLVHIKTMQTLNLGVFSVLEETEVYQLACQSVVHQLHWDGALVVTFQGSRGIVKASYQLTEQQLNHLNDYLGNSPIVREAYSQKTALNTYRTDDTTALALRSLFHTDQVVAMPIVFGDHFYGYLIACAHTAENENRNEEDVEFLATLASLIAHAVLNTTNFMSLEEQNTKLRQLDELKDSFISITSHQLRTPLSIIKWILSILQSDEKIKALEEQYKLVGEAYVSNERLIHVVNDLLNVSRIQEGKLPYNPQLMDIRVVLRDLCDAADHLCAPKHITLTRELDEEIPALQLDPLLFKEALQNILDNAVDYNQENGSIVVHLTKNEKDVVLTIRNTGQGISAEDMDSIFNQFYRSKSAIQIHPNGNGLGLYLTKAIIIEHGGTITCASELDKETVFTITIPL